MTRLSISKEFRDEFAKVQGRITAIETELEELDDERLRLQSAPVSRAEALALVDDELERLAREGKAKIFATIRSAGKGNRPDVYGMFQTKTAEGRETDVKVLTTVLSSAIRETASTMIRDSDAFSDDSFTADERARQLTKVDERVEKLEAERQNLIGELKSAGFSVSDELETEDVD